MNTENKRRRPKPEVIIQTEREYICRDIDVATPCGWLCVTLLLSAWIASHKDVHVPLKDEIREELCNELGYNEYIEGTCADILRPDRGINGNS